MPHRNKDTVNHVGRSTQCGPTINTLASYMANAQDVRQYQGMFDPQLHITLGYSSADDAQGWAATLDTLELYGNHVTVAGVVDTGLGWSIEAQFTDPDTGSRAVRHWNKAVRRRAPKKSVA